MRFCQTYFKGLGAQNVRKKAANDNTNTTHCDLDYKIKNYADGPIAKHEQRVDGASWLLAQPDWSNASFDAPMMRMCLFYSPLDRPTFDDLKTTLTVHA